MPRCDYLFVVDSDVQLDNTFALKLLIEQNRAVVAPLLIRPYTAWSNFWGRWVSELFLPLDGVFSSYIFNSCKVLT